MLSTRTVLLAALIAGSSYGQSLPVRALNVLEQRCYSCHRDQTAMSGLRLTARHLVLKGGKRGPAAHPGNAADSLLVNAILHHGPLAMPPGPKLPDEEIAVIREWIDQGMEWPERASPAAKTSTWWAFQPVRRPDVPAIEDTKNPIDAFILQKLRAQKLEPAPQ